MRDDRPSLTAAFVAFARGVGVRGDVPDPVARRLLPFPLSTLLSVLDLRSARRTLRPALRLASLGLVDHMALRTLAIDEALRAGVGRGASQLVILGAGLDARAYRLSALCDVDVFEVDHPATQAYKTAQVGSARPHARSLRYVAVDFARERLGDRLAEAGHDAERPTFWIWEGVTPYLPRIAVVATLGELQARSARGSGLAVTYQVPDVVPFGPGSERVADMLFQGLGEPLVGAIPSDELINLLGGASFRTISDTGSEDWSRVHGTSGLLPVLFRAERLAVAVREEG